MIPAVRRQNPSERDSVCVRETSAKQGTYIRAELSICSRFGPITAVRRHNPLVEALVRVRKTYAKQGRYVRAELVNIFMM